RGEADEDRRLEHGMGGKPGDEPLDELLREKRQRREQRERPRRRPAAQPPDAAQEQRDRDDGHADPEELRRVAEVAVDPSVPGTRADERVAERVPRQAARGPERERETEQWPAKPHPGKRRRTRA